MGRARVETPEEEVKQEEKQVETPAVEEEKEKKDDKAEYIIEVKNKSYTGTAANVKFKNGVGITKNPLLADYFKARGAKITKK